MIPGVVSEVGVAVETKLHEKNPGEKVPLTKLFKKKKRQLSNSENPDERVDESSVSRFGENRPRSSVVSSPGDAATLDPLTSSSGSAAQIDPPAPPDALLLCWTLVSDNAVPTGYEQEFATLETSIQRASESALRLSTRMNNMTSAVWLHQREEKLNSEEVVRRPVSSRSPVPSNTFQGKVAAVVLRRSHSPPGRRRGSQKQVGGDSGFSPERYVDTHGRTSEQECRQRLRLLGGARRATTLRARGRTVKKYLAWLALAHEETFPSEVHHVSEYLQMRHSEPCARGGLKSTHEALVFMEDIAAVETKLTQVPLYSILHKELLSSTLTGGGTRDRHRGSRQSWSKRSKTQSLTRRRDLTSGCTHGFSCCNVGPLCVSRITEALSQTRSVR